VLSSKPTGGLILCENAAGTIPNIAAETVAITSNMVIGLLAITSIPTVTGVAFGTSEQRKANQRKEDARRMLKFNIEAECVGDTDDDRDLHGRRVVVRNEKVRFALSSVVASLWYR
jgi:hypothetical protein